MDRQRRAEHQYRHEFFNTWCKILCSVSESLSLTDWWNKFRKTLLAIVMSPFTNVSMVWTLCVFQGHGHMVCHHLHDWLIDWLIDWFWLIDRSMVWTLCVYRVMVWDRTKVRWWMFHFHFVKPMTMNVSLYVFVLFNKVCSSLGHFCLERKSLCVCHV